MVRTYRVLAVARLRSDLQYRASFALFTISQFLIVALEFVGVLIVFDNVPSLAGWSVEEVTFLYGVANLSFSLADLFVSAIETVQEQIRTGTFDRLLLRPASPLVQVIADQFSLRRIGKVAEGATVFTIGCVVADIHWSLFKAAYLVITVLSGAAIFSGLWIMTSTLCFWWVEAREAQNAVTYGGNFLAQYPIGIYGSILRLVLAYAVPIAFVNYFPAVYVLDRHDRLGMPDWTYLASPLVAVAMTVLSGLMWRVAVRRYRSTGS